MTQPPAITVDYRAGVLHAVMRDPSRNALGESLIETLAAVVEEFERGEAKVLVLSSALFEFFATGAEVLGSRAFRSSSWPTTATGSDLSWRGFRSTAEDSDIADRTGRQAAA